MTVSIIGTGQSPYTRHPQPGTETSQVIARAVRNALREAGLTPGEVDGFAVSSFTLNPDHAIDLAWRMGLRLTWLMQDTNGGASAGGMLQHAVRAIEAGDAKVIVLAAGDLMDGPAFSQLVASYNRATQDHLAPLPMNGPNALFAMLTTRQMEALGLTREDYGHIAIAQREWAADNPGAVYRKALTMDEYLSAPAVATPLGRYDCVPPVTGADAVVLVADPGNGTPRAKVLTVRASYNTDQQAGDGLETGLRACAQPGWEEAGIGPGDVGLACVYDDYPSMVVAQLADLGVLPADDHPADFIKRRIATRELPVNTSGGQLSAGQAGAAGGMHGLVEAARQLMGTAGERQVSARHAVVSGYGMVLYRYGACATMSVLEAAK
ncbi:thiolase family protein [Pseudarthrobacter sp. NPDC057230]|uniref:thiolase family protein n=1 Tax=Pseudarthrobacter sp. NPDC057230 TaxID=3346057 RepID=UPI003636561E